MLKMGVRVCPSIWYQMAQFRVLAHGLFPGKVACINFYFILCSKFYIQSPSLLLSFSPMLVPL